ncbi:carboxylesterase family protein [Streptomyces albus subsp. chlorinus]|uniref:carboxylesterase/lipase family protein n=1 Tax=Streptomyces albus TaxID=1888 RepID=UPI001571315F|nr:carboxylesterase family protein [Streptomyces albus]NSC20271.1 carboxylesterase family protein [Streptomyces albus subsp. chlorinus]
MSPRPTAAPHVTVSTRYGPVRGERRATGVRFLGIPYARPPVGPLRFAAPVPPEPWTDVRDATAYGPTAQRRPFAEVTTIPEPSVPGEGTLNLNVFTPDPDPAARLPVLVWIHGGGFVAGSAASPWYDGAAFNRDGVVLVSVGYRLGIEGFLHLPDAPDNRGVRDWTAALEWVRDSIDRFGGDPGKVTVAGQSAGGGAVQTLLATPAARGLFRAAVSVSGAVMHPQGRAVAEAVTRLFTERTGLPATAAALRGLPDGALLAHQDALTAPGGARDGLPMLLLAPFADGELIPRAVPDALAAGDTCADVPLLAGCTAREFTGAGGPDVTEADVRALLASLGLDEKRARLFLDTYACHAGDPAALWWQALTDTTFRAPALALADAWAARGRPVWLYQFEWAAAAPGRPRLASHCVDLPFAFDLLGADGVTAALGQDPPQHLADAVHAAWVAFVRDLDPGAGWPRCTAQGRETMLWDSEPRIQRDPLRPVREIWLRSAPSVPRARSAPEAGPVPSEGAPRRRG